MINVSIYLASDSNTDHRLLRRTLDRSVRYSTSETPDVKSQTVSRLTFDVSSLPNSRFTIDDSRQ